MFIDFKARALLTIILFASVRTKHADKRHAELPVIDTRTSYKMLSPNKFLNKLGSGELQLQNSVVPHIGVTEKEAQRWSYNQEAAIAVPVAF